MYHTYGWDVTQLQIMLNVLSHLEYLDLKFTNCDSCGPLGLDLACNLPRLRRFRISSGLLPAGAQTFLPRHPQLEEINVTCGGGFVLRRGDLPNLHALKIDQGTLAHTAGLTDSDVGDCLHVSYAHLVTWSVPSAGIDTSPVRRFTRAMAQHLRCLVLQSRWYVEGAGLQALLGDLPELVEFGCIVDTQEEQEENHPPLDEKDLVRGLTSLHPSHAN